MTLTHIDFLVKLQAHRPVELEPGGRQRHHGMALCFLIRARTRRSCGWCSIPCQSFPLHGEASCYARV